VGLGTDAALGTLQLERTDGLLGNAGCLHHGP
jgi:hypothetical protein